MANRLASENAAAGDALPPRDHNNPPTSVELLTSELNETYALEFAKVDPIRQRANARAQEIKTDDDLRAWTVIYNDAKALETTLDAARLNEQRPLTAAIKNVFGPRQAPLQTIMAWIKKTADDFNREKVRKQRAEEAEERARLQKIADDARRDAEIATEFQDTSAAVEHVQSMAVAEQQIAQATAAAPTTADVARVRSDSGAMSTAQAVWKFEVADYSKVDLNSIRAFFTPAEIDKAVGKIVRLQKGATKVEGVRVFEDVGTQFRN